MKRVPGVGLLFGIACLVLFPLDARSQGHFVQHGFQVTAPSVSLSENRSKLAFAIGYHVHRVVELGLGLERVSDSRSKIVTMSWVPFAAVYPLIQSASVPFSVRLGAAYETQSLAGDPITLLEEDGLQSDGRSYRLEIGVSRRIGLTWSLFGRKVHFVPILSFSWESATVETGGVESEDRLVSFYGDFVAEIDAGGMARVVFGPRIGVIDDEFAAGFSLGLVAGYGY